MQTRKCTDLSAFKFNHLSNFVNYIFEGHMIYWQNDFYNEKNLYFPLIHTKNRTSRKLLKNIFIFFRQ